MAGVGEAKEIGKRLRAIRERKGWSLEELATRASLGANDLLAVERGTRAPSVGDLINLAQALGVSAGQFFESENRPRRIEIVRSGERWRVERDPSEAGAALSYSYEALSFRLSDRMMQPFLIEVRLNPGEVAQPSHHEGEEFLYVLEGELELEIAGEKHLLGAGDSAYYDSHLPHVLRAVSARPPRAIVVVATAPHARDAGADPALNRAF